MIRAREKESALLRSPSGSISVPKCDVHPVRKACVILHPESDQMSAKPVP